MYWFMKESVQSGPISPVQQSWLDSMLTRIQAPLKRSKKQKKIIHDCFEIVKQEFIDSMKESMSKFSTHLKFFSWGCKELHVKNFIFSFFLRINLTFTSQPPL